MEHDKVEVAFTVIGKEIELIMEALNDEGAKAFRSGSYEQVDKLRRVAEELGAFHETARQLHTHWVAKFGPDNGLPIPHRPAQTQSPAPQPEMQMAEEGTGLLGRLGHV
jgi:hypothetical protein